jgi:hypothetical protein
MSHHLLLLASWALAVKVISSRHDDVAEATKVQSAHSECLTFDTVLMLLLAINVPAAALKEAAVHWCSGAIGHVMALSTMRLQLNLSVRRGASRG